MFNRKDSFNLQHVISDVNNQWRELLKSEDLPQEDVCFYTKGTFGSIDGYAISTNSNSIYEMLGGFFSAAQLCQRFYS